MIFIGLPIIPDVTQDQSYIDIVESIALEETALSHLLNAEGEKLQAAGMLMQNGEMTPEQVIDFQDSIVKIIQTTIKMQMLLQFKLENILEVMKKKVVIHVNVATVTAEYDGQTYTDTDPAYYYTEEVELP